MQYFELDKIVMDEWMKSLHKQGPCPNIISNVKAKLVSSTVL